MCKTKKNTDAISPKPLSSRTPTSPNTSLASTTDFITNSISTPSSSLHWSSDTSTSLSTLRESLPQNPNIYAFSEILAATNNFLSKPSTSSTCRCSIRGKDVVITRSKSRPQFQPSDLPHRLSTICRSHHGSIIKLLGASLSKDHIYLVYDYVNGSDLATCLRNPRNPNYTVLSTWMSRMQIATDLAQGLEYIHYYTGLDLCLIHNRIKSKSVIVTEPNFNGKICYFGASILSGESEIGKLKRSDSRDRKIEGTRGYMSPEFLTTGIVSQKSDVFALGIVLLEILSGKEALKYVLDEMSGEYKRESVIESAREAVDRGRMREWIDGRLKDSFPEEVAERMTRVALDCVHVEANERPDMRVVAGNVSKFYLESRVWSETVRFPTEFSLSLAPR